ncbi:MAG: hypothetical protein AAF483_26880 [Planctomycetota bacterium]
MAAIYITPMLDNYRVDRKNPFDPLELFEAESEQVSLMLKYLVDRGFLKTTDYDPKLFRKFRQFIAGNFDIPWTSVSMRCQHLIYAINAIHRPENMIAAGIFCGATFANNAGAAVGPGAVYRAKNLVGIEIHEPSASLAATNIAKFKADSHCRIECTDAIRYCDTFEQPIDLLYLDAVVMNGKSTNLDGNSAHRQTKSLYYEILQVCLPKLKPGSLVLSHNSVDYAEELTDFHNTVRDTSIFKNSINFVMDTQGLEVSIR